MHSVERRERGWLSIGFVSTLILVCMMVTTAVALDLENASSNCDSERISLCGQNETFPVESPNLTSDFTNHDPIEEECSIINNISVKSDSGYDERTEENSTNDSIESFAGGTGTANDPYRVATAEQLNNVRNYPAAHFKQTAEINLGTAPWDEGEGWLPIGDSETRFTGTFDGDGHRIRGLSIDRPAARNQGLFGYIQNAKLTGINLEDVKITGGQYTGGLAGRLDQSIIDTVSACGEIQSESSHIGGLVGYCTGADTILYQISADMDVQGTNLVGGVAGQMDGGAVLTSYSIGSVQGTSYLGGLIGYISGSSASIANSYSHASVTGSNHLGGFAGAIASSGISGSYSAGAVSGAGENVGGFAGMSSGTTTDSYWDTEASGQAASAGGTGKATAEMYQTATYRGFNFQSFWQIEEGHGYPVFQDFSGYVPLQPVNLAHLAGSGTAADPYIITTPDELNAVRQGLNAHYRLGNDIDLASSVIWDYGRGWEPIGDSGNRFRGTFDGSGYTIRQMTINRPTAPGQGLFGCTYQSMITDLTLEDMYLWSGGSSGGLVGYMEQGEIRNSSIGGSVQGTGSSVGGVVGSMYSGEIRSVSAKGSVQGIHDVGNLVGLMSNGEIHNSYATGSVQGSNNVGGLVGYQGSGRVQTSYAVGSIQGTNRVGGIVGYNNYGEIRTSYATGSVQGTSSSVGGLVGQIFSGEIHDSYSRALVSGSQSSLGGFVGRMDSGSTIYRSYSTGTVTGTGSSAGGFAGSSSGTAWFSYWDTDTSGISTSAAGSGRTTADMTPPYAADTYVGWDFDDIWVIDTAKRNDGYPYLRALDPKVDGFAAFTAAPTLGSAPLAVRFTDLSRENPITWDWDFGDGGRSDEQHPTHEYTTPGIYTVSLTVATAEDEDTVIKENYINVESPAPPIANFTSDLTFGTAPLTIMFTDTSTKSPTAWDWDFGDGGTSDEQHPIHEYTTPGTFTVSLTVTNAQGEDTRIKEDYITVLNFAGGTGTAGDPYRVATAEHLNNIRYYPDAHFRQTADINLGTVPWNEGEGWLPIGDSETRFTGTYDGDGHRITELLIDRPEARNQGLFGYIQNARLTGINLEDVSITGGQYTGGLAGRLDQSIIDTVSVSGEIQSESSHIGGLVGYCTGADTVLYRISADMDVQGTNLVGGVAGQMDGGAVLTSYSIGSVQGTSYLGGLVGYISGSSASIANSYSHASVTGSNHLGGFAGAIASSGISGSYSAGAVSGTGENVGGFAGMSSGTTTDSYWDTEASGQAASAGGTGQTTAEMYQSATYRGFNFQSFWQIEEGQGYPVFLDFSGYVPLQPVNLAHLAGSGTATDPYIITTPDELNAVRQGLNAHYRLGNDIDLASSVIWDYGRGWEPIGDAEHHLNRFVGGFDGDGSTIWNLSIKRPISPYQGLFGCIDGTIINLTLDNVHVWGGEHSGGLVGCMLGGDIESSSVTGTVRGTENVGGLVGSMERSEIRASYATGSVQGRQRVGGVVGSMFNGKIHASSTSGLVQGDYVVGGLVGNMGQSEIRTSYATGSVQGSNSVGGLVGNMERGEIRTSYATGSVQGSQCVGGLVGYMWRGEIHDSYSRAFVSGSQWDVGGFVGQLGSGSTIYRSYSTGTVTRTTTEHWGGSSIGGFAGSSSGTAWFSHWDTDTSGTNTSAAGAGRSTADMTHPYAPDTYVGWDFDDVWVIDTESKNDGYPYLQAVDPESVFIAAFTAAPLTGAPPLTVWFTDHSTMDPTAWDWDFGDGGTSDEQNPAYEYTTLGTYTVSLTVTNADGTTTETKPGYITVTAAPTPPVTPAPPTPIPVPTPVDTITLSSGWNFVSTPKRLAEGNNTASIFADVDTDGRSIFLYNATTREWEIIKQDSTIQPLDAYWIYANETTLIPLVFQSGAVQVPPSKQLYEGWNAIGFSSTTAVTARDTLLDLSWTRALGWNSEGQEYDTAIIRGGTGANSDYRYLAPTMGYWIAMTEEGVLYALS